ncbi:MAG: tripartite tricarboxylate transporter substrate binding protein [Proteobacteria bacterium]|nr:tripartite tricarboxylate transporter substrate binding protein [Pseudomonadota bacterium]
MDRREFGGVVGAFALAAALPRAALAQEGWPSKPIRLIIPFPPSGGTDLLSRELAAAISAATKWVFVLDNRPGAGGNIGLEAAAKAAPDGYTIAMGQTANLAVNPALYAKNPFDALKDFAPIALVSAQPLILVVSGASPYKSLNDLVAAAKAKPGALNMGSPGNGTVGHIGGELFQRQAGIRCAHVPYKGAGPAVTDLMGGSIDLYFGNSQSVSTLVSSGRLRAIAVTSPKRMATFPNVPTIAESGYPGYEAGTWSGLVAPAGTPKAIVDRLNAEVVKALKTKALLDKLAADGSEAMGGTPQRFAEHIRSEHAKWGAVIRESGIKLD